MNAKEDLMIGQFFNYFSGHYVLLATPKGSAHTLLVRGKYQKELFLQKDVNCLIFYIYKALFRQWVSGSRFVCLPLPKGNPGVGQVSRGVET